MLERETDDPIEESYYWKHWRRTYQWGFKKEPEEDPINKKPKES